MEIYVKDNKALSLNSKLLSPAATGETYVMNESLLAGTGFNAIVAPNYFISNNVTYYGVNVIPNIVRYMDGVGNETTVYDAFNGGWQNQAYRTLVFNEPVTNAKLLEWLQANGVKQ